MISVNITGDFGAEHLKNSAMGVIPYSLMSAFAKHVFILGLICNLHFLSGLSESDDIVFTVLDFEDNQECLDLFEKKPLGVFPLLDEESNLTEASDSTFSNKLKNLLDANHCFKEERGGAFSVRHYAGEVLYDTNGFIEKNRDTLSSNSIQLISSCELLNLFSEVFNQSEEHGNSTFHFDALYSQKRGVGTNFKLRSCGVLEAVRISRAGYPTRMNHQEFSRRYEFLLSGTDVPRDPLSTSVAVFQKINIPSEMYQVGYTKLYLRAGHSGGAIER
ncbi:hypothetical protein TSUD_371530 [Trifolium subterraneum]|uniref:Myosin motor domain-containing protein n=1 Tax=Trifolium subterraneum TaxID=3900 RepID=A0A2Z6PL06_TRISU|nr:hypothetical protein TSUD_371530 [Trifolium subterraneum]